MKDVQLNGVDISDRTMPEHDCVGHQLSSVQFPDFYGNEFP